MYFCKKSLLGISLVGAVHAQASFDPAGSESHINTYTADVQDSSAVAIANDGSFVAVWRSNNQDGSGFGIFGQRFLSSGVKAGSEFQVNTYTASDQSSPSIAIAADGSFTVAWQSWVEDGSLLGIFGAHFSSSGVRVGSAFPVNTYTSGNQYSPAIAITRDSSFIVVWQSDVQDGNGFGIFGQHFSSSGVKDGSEFQVNTYTASDQSSPSITVAADNSFIVAWQSWYEDGDGCGVFGQRYSSSGVKTGSEFQVNTYTASDQSSPSIAVAADNSFTMVWQSYGEDGNGLGIFGQHFSSSGVKTGSEFQANTYTSGDQDRPWIAMAPDGSFTVVWRSNGQDGSGLGIFGQHYLSSGVKAGSEFQVNTYTSGDQDAPSIARIDSSIVVVWQSNLQEDGATWGIYGQRYAATTAAAKGPIKGSLRAWHRLSAQDGQIELRLFLPGMHYVKATAVVYDVRGRKTALLIGGQEKSGYRVLRSCGSRLMPGVYIVEFHAGDVNIRGTVCMTK
jgi:hypothetical protein